MKKIIISFIFVMCIAGLLFAELDFCDKTVLVVLRPEFSEYAGSRSADFFGSFEKVSVENIFQIHNEATIRALNERNPGEFRSIYKITLPTNDKAKVLEAIEELNTIEGIESATPDYITTTTLIPNDEYWNHPGLWALWGTHGVKGPEAWDIATGSHTVRVGVSDTGIANHPDLNANIDRTVGWNFASNNSNTTDTNSHGTRSAGIVGAVGNNGIGTVGINWNVTLIPLRIAEGSSSNESIMTAALNHAASFWGTPDEIQIVTMSFSGYGRLTGLRAAINNFPGLFVWSAGNDGVDIDSRLPQFGSFNLPNLLAVGAIDVNGQRSDWGGGQSSAYSSSGEHVHVFAPGTDGYTTSLNNGYQSYGGTSMAAPHGAGVAALLLSINPNLTAAELKVLITNNYDNITINTPHGSQVVKRLNAFKPAQLIAYDYDLAAAELTGPSSMTQHETSTFTINVRNNGKMPATGYTVRLMQVGNDTPLVSTPGLYMLQGISYNFTLDWTPSFVGQVQIYGQIVWAWDENPDNNQTAPQSFSIHPEGVYEILVGDPNSNFGRNDSFINYLTQNSITQTIYHENELMLGEIQQMNVRFTSAPSLVGENVEIKLYLAQTTKSQFSNNTDWIDYDNFTLVFQGALPVNNSGSYPVEIYFDTPYAYSGGNLAVMAIKDHNVQYGGGNVFQFTHLLGQYRTIIWGSNNAGSPPTNPFPTSHGFLEGVTNANFIILAGLGSPRNLEAISGNGVVQLSWQPPTTGLDDLIGYQLYRNDSTITTVISSLNYTDTAVTNGQIYTYFVRAIYTDQEQSPPSNTVYGYPDNIVAPGGISLQRQENNVTVSWTMPNVGNGFIRTENVGNGFVRSENNDTSTSPPLSYFMGGANASSSTTESQSEIGTTENGRAFLGFNVYRNGVRLTQSPISEQSYQDNNLPADIQYTYGVSTVYHRGESEIISDSIIVPTYNPPRELVAMGDVESVNLEWTTPLSQTFGTLAGYIINRDDVDLNTLQNIVTTPYFTDIDVIAGQNYVYRVKSVYTGQIEGESVYTNPENATPIDNILAPVYIMAEIVGNDIVVSWTMPDAQTSLRDKKQSSEQFIILNRAFIEYELERNDIPLTQTSSQTYTDISPEQDVSYIYRVRAIYDTGVSEWTESPTILIPRFNPVSELVSIIQNVGVLLMWTEPEEQNHGTPRYYNISRNGETIITVDYLVPVYLDTDVDYDVEYLYEVSVIYDEPNGESVAVSTSINTPIAFPITNPHGEYIDGGVSLTLTAPEPNFGSVTGYTIYRDGSLVNYVTTTSYIDNDVSFGVYIYSIISLYTQPAGQSEAVTIDVYVSDDDDIQPLLITELLGNYPNPFNPETTISFNIAVDSIVSIDIYNIRGHLVKTLLNNHLQQGNHTVIWNGIDNHGQQVSSGVYFYQMRTADYSEIKRMVLLK